MTIISDAGLAQHIRDFSTATGKPVREVARDALKSLVRYALQFTPPSTGKLQGQAAKRAGETAVLRDLGRMGFAPVTIKGFRTITQVYGRPLANPVRVPTKLNPKFSDPEGHHRARLIAAKGRGARITRGGKQAFYLDRRTFNSLKKKWLDQVGRLASGWVPAALELGLTVPLWIKRHAGLGRGTTVKPTVRGSHVGFQVINHFPAGTEDLATDVERRIAIFTGYVKNNLARQVNAKYAGAWGKTAKR